MPILFGKKKEEEKKPTSTKKFKGMWFFFSEMDRLGLWPEMTETRARRSLEYSSSPEVKGSEDQ